MGIERIKWSLTCIGSGWNRHEGSTSSTGPYVVEREYTRRFSVWWGGVEIGEAQDYATARRIAQAHSNGIQGATSVTKEEQS